MCIRDSQHTWREDHQATTLSAPLHLRVRMGMSRSAHPMHKNVQVMSKGFVPIQFWPRVVSCFFGFSNCECYRSWKHIEGEVTPLCLSIREQMLWKVILLDDRMRIPISNDNLLFIAGLKQFVGTAYYQIFISRHGNLPDYWRSGKGYIAVFLGWMITNFCKRVNYFNSAVIRRLTCYI